MLKVERDVFYFWAQRMPVPTENPESGEKSRVLGSLNVVSPHAQAEGADGYDDQPAMSRRAPLPTRPEEGAGDEANPLIEEYYRVGNELRARCEQQEKMRRGVVPGTVTSDSGWTHRGFDQGGPADSRTCL